MVSEMKGGVRHLFMATAVILASGSITVFLASIKTKTDMQRVELPSIGDVPEAYWQILAGERIFFGHQSVGYNIIDGITDVMNEYDHIKLNIVETCGLEAPDR